MVLKGLPGQYKTFTTVVTQKEREMLFMEFKVALRSFEETEKCQQPSASGVNGDRVMTAQPAQRTFGRDASARDRAIAWAGPRICFPLNAPGSVIFFPINAPGMGCFKLFDLVGYS